MKLKTPKEYFRDPTFWIGFTIGAILWFVSSAVASAQEFDPDSTLFYSYAPESVQCMSTMQRWHAANTGGWSVVAEMESGDNDTEYLVWGDGSGDYLLSIEYLLLSCVVADTVAPATE